MSDLHYLLILLTLAAWFYAVVTIRNDASRLHYRDRPLFWRAVTPLLAALAGVIVLLGLALLLSSALAMSDLHYLLILLTLAAWFYAVVTIRNDA
ncbi:hypothetical protein CTI14_60345, partial [Methylobacterium radiotolerans]